MNQLFKKTILVIIYFSLICLLVHEILNVKVTKTTDVFGSKTMPALIVALIVIISCILVFKNRLYQSEKQFLSKKDKTAISGFIFLTAYIAALQYLGFLLSTIIFLFAIEIWMGVLIQKKPALSLIYVITVPISLSIIFDTLLGMNLPGGDLIEWFLSLI